MAQVQGSLPSFVKLQASTPGTTQTGHLHISGTNVAGAFVGGGAGLTGVNADLLDGLNSTAFLQSVPVPLTLTGSSATHIVRAQNSSSATDAAAVYGFCTAATGITYGGRFDNSSTSGYGAIGITTATTGANFGLYGRSASSGGYGVAGVTTATTGFPVGVLGQCASANGYGVSGFNSAGTGIRGETQAPFGVGVFGFDSATTGIGKGVFGQSDSEDGIGVFGQASSQIGFNLGVYGLTSSRDGKGVYGYNTDASGGTGQGVYGRSDSALGSGVYGFAANTAGFQNYGVYGRSDGNSAVGVYGISTPSQGSGNGLTGESHGSTGRGVTGFNTSATGMNYGVVGTAVSTDGRGVYGEALNTTGNCYQGSIVTGPNGYAWVELPDYFAEINRNPLYTLTVVDDSADFVQAKISHKIELALSGKARSNKFQVRTSKGRVQVDWRVEGVRSDRWVQKNGAPTEVDKVGQEVGLYLEPELYGKPASRGIYYHPRSATHGESRIEKP
jgi:hypothetical protein